MLNWRCDPVAGRDGSGGMKCFGLDSGIFHLDTSYLVTPMLQINPDDTAAGIVLDFDTRTTSWSPGSRIYLMRTIDTSAHVDSDITPSVTPGFSITDSTEWVTHEENISRYCCTPFYLIFMYVSDAGSGSMWFLDNVRFRRIPLGVTNIKQPELKFSVVNTSPTEVLCALGCNIPGSYSLQLYDMTGRVIVANNIAAIDGENEVRLKDLNLSPGLYFISVGNAHERKTVRLIIPI